MSHLHLWSAALGLVWLATPLASQTAPSPPTRSEISPSSPSVPAFHASSATGFLQGVALDRINGGRLVDAKVQLEGTDRVAMTDSLGVFMLDGITPGSYRVLVDHPILDTLGIALATRPLTFVANEMTLAVVAVPSGEQLAARFCTAADQELGPGALAGRIRQPDSDLAVTGAQVVLAWFDPAPKSLSPRVAALMKKVPRVREATVGEGGRYRLCGLPERFDGQLQVRWSDGETSAEVPVRQEQGVLTLRSVSAARIVAATDSVKLSSSRGSATLNGFVTNKSGEPVVNARVGLVGHSASTVTGARGDFTLGALPAGTRTVSVRQIGYAPAELVVELSERTARTVSVKMGAYVPELPAVEVVAGRTAGLDRVGFTTRRRAAIGAHFLTPEQIDSRNVTRVTEFFSRIPTIRAVGGTRARLLARGKFFNWRGCVAVTVDGSQWGQLGPGELDSFLPPGDVAAIEAYDGVHIPPEFGQYGKSADAGDYCSAVVIWTKSYLLMQSRQ